MLQNEIARDLLSIKAVQIKTDSYFTWTSGIQSPIYCDNRLTMSYPKIREKIAEAFVAIIEEKQFKPDIVVGCATAGIPHAAWLAQRLNLPMAYVRSKPKGHGKGNQIEGEIKRGQKAVVIEDLISTGGSAIDAAKALQNEGVEVNAVLAIFTYGLAKAKQQFDQAQLSYATITNFDHLVSALVTDGELNEKEKEQLLTWRNEL